MKDSTKKTYLIVIGVIVCIAVIGFVIHSSTNDRRGGSSECNDNYSGACVPNVKNDIDCRAVGHSVTVVRKDVYHFDADGDGLGCESYGN
jgi:hypothetical protein